MSDPNRMENHHREAEALGYRLAAAIWIREEPSGGVSQRVAADGPWLRDLERANKMRTGGAAVPVVLTLAEGLAVAYSAPEADPADNAKARTSLLQIAAKRSERIGVRDHTVIWGGPG